MYHHAAQEWRNAIFPFLAGVCAIYVGLKYGAPRYASACVCVCVKYHRWLAYICMCIPYMSIYVDSNMVRLDMRLCVYMCQMLHLARLDMYVCNVNVNMCRLKYCAPRYAWVCVCVKYHIWLAYICMCIPYMSTYIDSNMVHLHMRRYACVCRTSHLARLDMSV